MFLSHSYFLHMNLGKWERTQQSPDSTPDIHPPPEISPRFILQPRQQNLEERSPHLLSWPSKTRTCKNRSRAGLQIHSAAGPNLLSNGTRPHFDPLEHSESNFRPCNLPERPQCRWENWAGELIKSETFGNCLERLLQGTWLFDTWTPESIIFSKFESTGKFESHELTSSFPQPSHRGIFSRFSQTWKDYNFNLPQTWLWIPNSTGRRNNWCCRGVT